MAADPELRGHLEWLGFVQPVGLVVSAPALVAQQAFVNRDIVRAQEQLRSHLEARRLGDDRSERRVLADFRRFCTDFLAWEPDDLVAADALPPELEVVLPEYGERLAPSFGVANPDAPEGAGPAGRFLLLIQELPVGQDLDAPLAHTERGWHASPQARFERLLRETQVPQGLLVNGASLRLVYAPRGESSGHLSFDFEALAQVAGRPLVSALHMLLSSERLFSLPSRQRLPALLAESRRYQNEVSTQLAEQVLEALLELLRGFRAADEASQGRLLADVLASQPDDVYGGLLVTLMRLVFLLYAEDRGLLPQDPVYAQHYSVAGLFEKLRDDAGRNPDSMDQRYGAWARLLTLFRLVHEGGAHAGLRLPARRGRLFDPDAYPFLEGRAPGSRWSEAGVLSPPRVPDGVIHRLLEKLLVLGGERLSYRALDVEQIGSVYEAMMGFRLERAKGVSLGVRPDHVVVDLEALLAAKPGERAKRLADEAGCKLAGEAAKALAAAKKPEDVVAALGRRASPLTPRVLPQGALVLQPTEERRRSGAHYTPRSLTEPIVRTTLEPLLSALGPSPRAEQVLGLRVCDPAMGSGAFLVEACRFLGDALTRSWEAHGDTPVIPPDEDPQLYARRLVAQRCLYGVDKNLFAVDLAKLSLWLVTLAKDHPFTFIDHALRCGDSLVGLSQGQLAGFHWEPQKQLSSVQLLLTPRVKQAEELRGRIQALAGSDDTAEKTRLLAEADAVLEDLRLVGDLAIAAFFGEEKEKPREAERKRLEGQLELWLGGGGDRAALDARRAELRRGEHAVLPFHWEIEFPEVFSRENPGFDAFVGNPPFMGGRKISEVLGGIYSGWLLTLQSESSGGADLVAHFYRRAFGLLRKDGAFGLIATNTIAQGDTRESGLRWICTHGGAIYAARKRVKWPGAAAVLVSVVHVAKGEGPVQRLLDARPVEQVTAFLFHEGGHESPAVLAANAGKSFQGSIVLGMGFTFDDESDQGTPLAEMEQLIRKDPRNRERIFPYIGGEELNDSPTHAHRRCIIDFGEMTEGQARKWPDLWSIVEAKVKPERVTKDARKYPRMVNEWWKFWNARPELHAAIAGLERVLACTLHSKHLAFAYLRTRSVYQHGLAVFVLAEYAAFCALQSRPHEVWARFFGSSLEDRLRYTPSDCFETFPFPDGWETSAALEEAGRVYYEHRAALMVRNDEGLTKTYNRFHDDDEESAEIAQLRALHDTMDRAVLAAYGWSDLRPECKFLLEYEDEEVEAAPSGKQKKKPWRYRWPDELRDEVLARLLALNRARAQAELLAGAAAAKSETRKAKPKRTKRSSGSPGPLFE